MSDGSGGFLGMTGISVNAPDTPEILWEADVYDISAMFTSDGSIEISCGAALT
jgi:hypothetical protein